jgi:hypothetical protein
VTEYILTCTGPEIPDLIPNIPPERPRGPSQDPPGPGQPDSPDVFPPGQPEIPPQVIPVLAAPFGIATSTARRGIRTPSSAG